MKKRLMAALLTLALCFSLASPVMAVAPTFTDVPEGHWAAESIRRAVELGIFSGQSKTEFGLGQPIERASFVTALVRLFGWEKVSPDTATFTDVTQTDWFYSAVETAVANGAVIPVDDRFCPTQALNREDMASMILRALGYASLAGVVAKHDCPFTDVSSNKGYVTMAYHMGIVNGMGGGHFAPDAFASREQAAVILVRLYDKLHTESREVRMTDAAFTIRVTAPGPTEGTSLPLTPLEPIEELYKALAEMKKSGADPADAALVLTSGGIQTVTSQDGEIISSKSLSEIQVKRILARDDVRLYYSQRYESAYCVYEPNTYQRVTVWYQSEKSIAVKLQLARLFGVTQYTFQ